jgi:LPXTG-site transpeptidase (sortase) family protein
VLVFVASGIAACSAEHDTAPRTRIAQTPATSLPVEPPAEWLVPQAAPTAISIPALGLTARVRVMSASACPVLDPPTLQDAYWVQCRAKPGTNSDGTVLIIGHAVAGGHGVFNDLPQAAVGDDVQLTTESGRLTYQIDHTANYDKNGSIQRAPEILERVPGRLVLVTCYLQPGDTPTDQNFVVQAELAAASPQP